jgi:hypothetical protein
MAARLALLLCLSLGLSGSGVRSQESLADLLRPALDHHSHRDPAHASAHESWHLFWNFTLQPVRSTREKQLKACCSSSLAIFHSP